MANRKISDLTALTAPATGDLLPIVDISEAAAADKNKKITYGELLASAPAGSAAAPSFSFEGDSNTGIYSPGADQVAISTAGSERVRINSTGLVGIGTSAPIQQLSVHGTANDTIDETTGICKLQDSGGNGLIFGTRASSPYQAYIQSAFVTDTSVAQYSLLLNPLGGNVVIGSTVSTATFTIVDSANFPFIHWNNSSNTTIAFAGWHGGSGGGDDFRLGTASTKPITFQTNNSESARIDSSGRLLVGTSSDSGGALFQVNGDRIRVGTAKTPASASATGTAGEICWDASYIYVCTATNTWKRTAITTW
jgi:hypothetical protein